MDSHGYFDFDHTPFGLLQAPRLLGDDPARQCSRDTGALFKPKRFVLL
jgi:hypothetical protein